MGSAKGGMNHGGIGPGPWIMGDLENGLWGTNITASQEPTIAHTFVTAMLKGDSGPSPGHFAIKGGDAQEGELRVYWDGGRPKGYAPMKKQGSIVSCFWGLGGGRRFPRLRMLFSPPHHHSLNAHAPNRSLALAAMTVMAQPGRSMRAP